MFVYTVYKEISPVPTAVDLLGSWIDSATGRKIEKAFYEKHDDRPDCRNVLKELKDSTVYAYEQALEYPLACDCQGRDWHDMLGQLVGFDKDNQDAYLADGPFAELLTDAYQGTTLGPRTSAKLVADFDAWDERARSFSDDGEFYLTFWWVRTCLSHAIKNGAVKLN
ncbi:conserved protein of unknown function (plasmid) [Cupriavidus taiwanensis]|uniref:Uncharacterized protein n=1 Tax=Cupriavidus taiwanensis TaxID=164546 RepID=A0A375IPK7_9BURK|nr:hypothetical protein [Cupriavidus taiwanensis]SPK76041.1 conserved protein of unknown function [Cupriavidus taiwanensis]